MDIYVSQKIHPQNIQNDIQNRNQNNFEIDHIVEESTYPFSHMEDFSLKRVKHTIYKYYL